MKRRTRQTLPGLYSQVRRAATAAKLSVSSCFLIMSGGLIAYLCDYSRYMAQIQRSPSLLLTSANGASLHPRSLLQIRSLQSHHLRGSRPTRTLHLPGHGHDRHLRSRALRKALWANGQCLANVTDVHLLLLLLPRATIDMHKAETSFPRIEGQLRGPARRVVGERLRMRLCVDEIPLYPTSLKDPACLVPRGYNGKGLLI